MSQFPFSGVFALGVLIPCSVPNELPHLPTVECSSPSQSLQTLEQSELSTNAEYSRLLRICRRLVRSPVDVEGIAQELWVREVQRGRKAYYVEIRNYCFDKLRNERARAKAELESVSKQANHQDTQGINGQDGTGHSDAPLELLLKLASLSSIEQLIIYKHFWLGETDLSISQTFGIHVGEVSLLRQNALRKIREASKNVEL